MIEWTEYTKLADFIGLVNANRIPGMTIFVVGEFDEISFDVLEAATIGQINALSTKKYLRAASQKDVEKFVKSLFSYHHQIQTICLLRWSQCDFASIDLPFDCYADNSLLNYIIELAYFRDIDIIIKKPNLFQVGKDQSLQMSKTILSTWRRVTYSNIT